MTDQQETILALLDWSAHTGRELPYPAETIATLEAEGHVVDLITGEVVYDGAGERIALTTLGEAVKVVLACDVEGGRYGHDAPAGPLE